MGPVRPTFSVLLEREQALARIDDALEGARGGDGRLVLVEGEAGIGKSRLLGCAVELAGTRGMEVLSARATELGRDLPFGCALRWFEGLLHDVSPAERAALLRGAARHATPLIEGLTPGAGREIGQMFPLLHGLSWLTANIADQRPLLLVLDDAQWADQPTLRFCAYLAERVSELPVAMLLAARPAEPGGDTDVLPRLRDAAEIVSAQRLSRAAVERIVATRIAADGPELVDACAEMTGGNPFLLLELLAALEAEQLDAAADAAGRAREIGPAPVARLVTLTLGRLPPEATALVRALAILGDGASVRHVAALADIDEQCAASAARGLVDAGVLGADGLAFAHPILRSALYEELTAAERVVGHVGAARILAEAGEPAAVVAAQLLNAEPVGEAWAARALREAAVRAAASGAPEIAVRHLRRALREPTGRDPATLLELGIAEAAVGDPAAGGDLARAAKELSDGPAAARAELLHGRLLFQTGRAGDALDAFERGLARLGGAGQGLELELEAGAALAGMWDTDRGPEAFRRVGRLLEEGRVPSTQGERNVLVMASAEKLIAREDRERCADLARRAWDGGAFLAESGTDDPMLYAISGSLSWSGEYVESLAVLEAALAESQAQATIHGFASVSHSLAYTGLLCGRVAESASHAELAIDAARFGWEVYLPSTMAVLARARHELGDAGGATRALDLSAEDEERFAATSSAWPAYLEGRALLRLSAGEPRLALADALAAGEALQRGLRTRNPEILAWRSLAAVAHGRLGDRTEAERLAEDELADARHWGAPRAIAVALGRRASLEPPAAALELLTEAREVVEGTEAVLQRVHALVDLGSALRRANKRAAAREPLERALEEARRIGAVVLARRARDELERAGVSVRSRGDDARDRLTPGERRVVGMAASGMTNREIAEALFVTVKAVKFHLGNAYSKLGIASRGELAGALERAGGIS